jgi:hypothetical protein
MLHIRTAIIFAVGAVLLTTLFPVTPGLARGNHFAHRAPVAKNGTFTHKGIPLTVSRRATDTKGQGVFHPKKAEEWEFLYLVFRGIDGRPHTYNPADIQLIDGSGETRRYGFTYNPKHGPRINVGTLSGHGRAAGWAGYIIPRNTRSFTVTWSDAYTLRPPASVGHYTIP